MKTHEVSMTTFKQYMVLGDGPILAYEDENFIMLYMTVGMYEFCLKQPKTSPQQAAVFKQEYLISNPRVVFPLREVKDKPKIHIDIESEPDVPRIDPERIVDDIPSDSELLIEESQPVQESTDTEVVG